MTPKLVSKISIVINVMLAGSKLIFGFMIGSMTIIADGINSTLDVLSSIMIFFGVKQANRPADRSHPYGHEKFESLAAFGVVILIGVTAFLIMSEAVQALISGEVLTEIPPEAFYLFTVIFLINMGASKIKMKIGKAYHSKGLITDGKHSELDALISIGILAGLLLISRFPVLDGLIAIVISVYIFHSGFRLYKKTAPALVDKSCPETEKRIKEHLKRKELEIVGIKTRKSGRKCIAEITVEFDPDKKIGLVSSITKDLEQELSREINKLKSASLQIRSESSKVEN